MTSRNTQYFTREQAALLGLLAAHGTVWLGVMSFRPSFQAGLICLASYATVLAAVALILSARRARDRGRRCADCDTWSGPADTECVCCGGNRWQPAPPHPGGSPRH